jgi:hypothetical protein
MQVVTQPLFHLFIAFSILLSISYFRGSRKNKKIYLSAFNSLKDIIKPGNEIYTNIGGLTGHHAKFIPKGNSPFREAEATITLLPRQSGLYYPFSRMLMKMDRLFISFTLNKKFPETVTEAHLIEKKFATFKTVKIHNPEDFTIDEVKWGSEDFFIYYKDDKGKKCFNNLLNSVSDPGKIKHLAVVPEHKRIFVFMIPVYGKVGEWFSLVYPWMKGFASGQ